MNRNDDRYGFDRLDEDEQSYHAVFAMHHNNTNNMRPLGQTTITDISKPAIANDYNTASPYWQQLQFSTEKIREPKKMEQEKSDNSTFDATTDYDQAAALNSPKTKPAKEKSSNNKKNSDGDSSGIDELLSTISFSIINVIATCIMVGMLIYVYQYANGKSTDTVMAGMTVPTVVSLFMTIVKILVAGGIARYIYTI